MVSPQNPARSFPYINVSPNISPVFSPAQSNTQTTTSPPERKSSSGELLPDIRFIRYSSEFNSRIGEGRKCFVLSFRNDGNEDATNVIAHISYTRSPGHAMVVDYGGWVEHESIMNIFRGHTKKLIFAVSEDERNFAVNDTGPATNYTQSRLVSVGEIAPAKWLMVVTLSADNFRRDYTFDLNVGENGSLLLYPEGATRPPQDQRPKKADTTPQPNVGSLRPETTTVVHNTESDLWSRGGGGGAVPAALLPFSNEARPSQKAASVQGIRARLTYYKKDHIEEFKRVDSGCWAGEAYRYADLEVGDVVYLIAAVQINTQAHVIVNPRRSMTRYAEDHTVVESLPAGKYELKVDLTAGEHGEYAETYWFEIDIWAELKIRRLNQRPAALG